MWRSLNANLAGKRDTCTQAGKLSGAPSGTALGL